MQTKSSATLRDYNVPGRSARSIKVLAVLVLAIAIGVPASSRAEDCNNNGVPDDVEIAMGTSPDCNLNGVPDDCDLDNPSDLYFADLRFNTPPHPRTVHAADLDGDGDLDLTITYSQNAGYVSVYRNLGNGTFGPGYVYGAGFAQVTSIAIGDLDGDNDLDIAVGGDAEFSILLNNGNATFSPSVHYPNDDVGGELALGDLDGDGDLDLVSSTLQFNHFVLSAIFNDGDGNFNGVVHFSPNADPLHIALGDIDGDDDIDIVCGLSSRHIGVLPNLGLGDFGNFAYFDVVAYPGPLNLFDVDGDGVLELAVTGAPFDHVTIMENAGDGTLQIDSTYFVSDSPSDTDFGDIDEDGDIDLVFESYRDRNVSILFNDGGGSFSARESVALPETPEGVALADVTSDGHLDIVATVSSALSGIYAVHVFPRLDGDCNADGVPDECEVASAPALDCNGNKVLDACDLASLISSDCNENGHPDECDIEGIASDDCNGNGVPDECDLASGTSSDCNENAIPDECEILNAADLFGPAVSYGVLPYSINELALGDINGDAAVDIVVKAGGPSQDYRALLNNQDGTFTQQLLIGNQGIGEFVLRDFDGDGDLDIAEISSSAGTGRLLVNNGNATFTQGAAFTTDQLPRGLNAGDLDGDGDIDIVVSTWTNKTVSVLLNNGNGTFGPDVRYPIGAGPETVAMGDFDGDNDIDLAVVNTVDDSLSLLFNTGNGSFAATQTLEINPSPFVAEPHDVDAADVNGDGFDDLIVAAYTTIDLGVLISNGDGSFAAPALYLAPNEPFSVDVNDVNGDGHLDIVAANYRYSSAAQDSISLLLNNGDGTFGIRALYNAGFEPGKILIGDLDNDGDNDFVAMNQLSSSHLAIFIRQDEDCNGNGLPDDCELEGNDCNHNFRLDSCEIDSDADGVPDACDACPGFDDTIDSDSDGIPDGCEIECVNPLLGDVDDSGDVDAADVPRFAELLVAPATATVAEFCTADVNEDDHLSSLDIRIFLQILLAP